MTQRKAAYASMEQQLLGELKHTKAMNSRLQQHITKQKMSAAKYDSQINKLTTDEEMAKKDILTLKKLNSEIAKAEQEDIGLLKAVMKEMVFKNETLTSAESLNQQRIKLSKEINLLKISVNNLAANKKQLTQYKLNINSKLANKS